MILSPAVPTMEVERSDDFEECTIMERLSLISGQMSPFFSRLVPTVGKDVMCVTLDEAAATHFVSTAQRIAARETLIPDAEVFKELNQHIASLMRVEIIVEVLYEIASRRNPTTEKPSRGEQVFVGFVQSLACIMPTGAKWATMPPRPASRCAISRRSSRNTRAILLCIGSTFSSSAGPSTC